MSILSAVGQGRLKVLSLSRSKVDGAERMAHFVKLVCRGSESRFRSNSRGSAAIDRYDWERTETRCRPGLGELRSVTVFWSNKRRSKEATQLVFMLTTDILGSDD